jgi:hypothetical protein
MAISNNACDCCNAPPCEAPVLEYVSSEGSCDFECAYYDWATAKNYSTKVVTHGYGQKTTYVARRLGAGETIPALIQPADPDDPESQDVELAPALGEGDCVFEQTCSGAYTQTDDSIFTPWGDPPPDCSAYSASINLATTNTWTGTGTYDANGLLRQGDGCSTVYSGSGSSSASTLDGSYSNTATVNADGSVDWSGGYGVFSCCTGSAYSSAPVATALLFYCDCFNSYYYCLNSETQTTYSPPVGEGGTVFSNPVTDCEVELPDYPAWPDETATPHLPGQGSAATAFLIVTGGFGLVEKRKINYRLKFIPPGTCYLKVWLRKTTTIAAEPYAEPPVEASTTHDDSETYEWLGTGNPCLTDATKSYSDNANRIESPPTEIPVPTIECEVSVSILKYSCVKDYEPDITDPDNEQPNGFPDPAWEAAPP